MDLRVLMWVAAVGQTVFVTMWATLPWWREWVGRALMWKSAALCAVLWFWVSSYHLPEYAWQDELRELLLLLVAVGIWLQVIALGIEIHRNRRSRERRRAAA